MGVSNLTLQQRYPRSRLPNNQFTNSIKLETGLTRRAQDDLDGIHEPRKPLIWILNSIEQMREHRWYEEIANPERQSGCDDEPISTRKLGIREDADARGCYRSKQECGHTAQYGIWNCACWLVRNRGEREWGTCWLRIHRIFCPRRRRGLGRSNTICQRICLHILL